MYKFHYLPDILRKTYLYKNNLIYLKKYAKVVRKLLSSASLIVFVVLLIYNPADKNTHKPY